MKRDILHQILSEQKELSSLPQVVSEVLKISADPDSATADMAKAIMKDPNLTARLLRVANSPFYTSVQQITTINQAVVTLGMRAVTAMALAASVYNLANSINSSIDRKRFWRHSLEVAMASQEIARAIKYESPEEAFVCGLLHDIGILILEASFPDAYAKIWRLAEAGESLAKMEEENWGTNHARVGQFLLRQWGLPEILSEAVGGHHVIFGAEDNYPYQQIILTVNLANRISRFNVGNVPPPEAVEIELKRTLMGSLDITESRLADIERNLISEVVNESGFLEIEIGSVEEILNEANRMLYDQYLIVESLLHENLRMREEKVSGHADQTDDNLARDILALLGNYLNDVTSSIRKRALILKSAVNRGDISDKKGIASVSVDAISNGTNSVASIVEELKKLENMDHKNQFNISDLKITLNKHIKQLEQHEKPELVR